MRECGISSDHLGSASRDGDGLQELAQGHDNGEMELNQPRCSNLWMHKI